MHPPRSAWSLLALALLLLLAACGGPAVPQTAASAAPSAPSEAQATKPATAPSVAPSAAPSPSPAAASAPPMADPAALHIQQPYFPPTLDPHLTNDVSEIGVLALAYEGLTRLTSDLEPAPAAAESWRFSPAGDVITFTLRANLTYSDGSPLTAADFGFAIARSCDPTLAAAYSYVLFDVVGCEPFATTPVSDTAAYAANRQALQAAVTSPDAQTLTIRLTHPAPYFPSIAGLWVLYPVKREIVEQDGVDWWKTAAKHVGNGPFVIADIAPEQRIAFTANSHYWGGVPNTRAIEYVYLSDSAVALEAYQAGQLDIMTPDPSQLPIITGDVTLREELVTYPGATASLIQLNLTDEPFNDIHVRKAFAFAMDRATLCTTILHDACVPSLSWVPPGVAGSITTDAFAFDPAKARAELAASRYGSAEQLPPIKFTYASVDPADQPRFEWLAQQIREILGVTIELEPLDVATLSDRVATHATFPQMVIWGWVQDYPDPQNWLSIIWDSRTSYAQAMGFHDATFDQLVRAADRELDPARRQDLYEQASRRLVELQPGIFLSNAALHFLVKPSVNGYTPTANDVNWPGQWGSQLTITRTP